MSIRIVRRRSTRSLTLDGTIRLPSGERIRIQRRACSDRLDLAREEAAALEAEILRSAFHGKRRTVRSFAEVVESYIKDTTKPRSDATRARLHRLLLAVGDVPLSDIDQTIIGRLKSQMLRPDSAPATVAREIVTPLNSILHHAHELGWYEGRYLKAAKTAAGRTVYMTPDQAERLIAAAAGHYQPLLMFLFGTGARASEALYLEWRDVDLQGARAIFWADQTKGGKRRDVRLPPRVVAALAGLPRRDGMVFQSHNGHAYIDNERRGGGQTKRAWHGARRRAGLEAAFYGPHVCRHSWASWHYAVHKDLLLLKLEGGWAMTQMVERYAHLLPQGHEAAIRRFWGEAVAVAAASAA